MTRAETVQAVQAHGVVAVIRMRDTEKLRACIRALADGGVRVFEVTMSVPGAVDILRELSSALPAGFLLGAGSVTDVPTAQAVIDAGARFVVSPVFTPEIIVACHERGVPAVPGCFSPTEMFTAYQSGADIVKLFPATSLGPQFLKDVRAPLPQIKLMVTGGVTIENAGEWIRAGAVAVGLGSALLDAAVIERGAFDVIAGRARAVVANVAAARERT